MAAGLVREIRTPGRRLGLRYQADPSAPGYLELRRFALVTIGIGARIRAVVAGIDPRALAWLHGPDTERADRIIRVRVAVITSSARRMRQELLSTELEPLQTLVLDAMSIAEWVTRLQRREMRLLAIRRAQRLWLLGDGQRLRRYERSEIDSRETLKRVIANWREELSDGWDEDYDPSLPGPWDRP